MNMSEIACEYPCIPTPFAEKTLKLCVSVKKISGPWMCQGYFLNLVLMLWSMSIHMPLRPAPYSSLPLLQVSKKI